MTWREAQMEEESRDLSVASQAVTWTEPRIGKRRELNKNRKDLLRPNIHDRLDLKYMNLTSAVFTLCIYYSLT